MHIHQFDHPRHPQRRARWAAIGAAVAVSVGAGGLMTASASIGTGERAVFVPITPCRLMDTRPAPMSVGPRSTPIGGGESYSTPVRGTNGSCTIPADAVGLVMNVAAVNPTAGSFLTVYPSDAIRPNAANLNWVAGQPPVSNAVTTDISTDGKVSFYNLGGTVDLTADVVGYFVDHDHDDRYVLKPTGASTAKLDAGEYRPDQGNTGFVHDFGAGRIEGAGTPSCATAPVHLPTGATITEVDAHVADNTAAGLNSNVIVQVWRNPIGPNVAELMSSSTTTGAPGDITLIATAITDPKVDNSADTYFSSVCGLQLANFFYDLSIVYTNP